MSIMHQSNLFQHNMLAMTVIIYLCLRYTFLLLPDTFLLLLVLFHFPSCLETLPPEPSASRRTMRRTLFSSRRMTYSSSWFLHRKSHAVSQLWTLLNRSRSLQRAGGFSGQSLGDLLSLQHLKVGREGRKEGGRKAKGQKLQKKDGAF